MTKLIGYARVSTRQQSADRQQIDILAVGVRRDDLYFDHGISGAQQASRPYFASALDALEDGDTLVITTLDRLGRSTQNMLAFAEELRGRGAGLRVLNLGGGDVDTSTPMGLMLLTIMAALEQMEHEIKRERVVDSITKRREAGKDLGDDIAVLGAAFGSVVTFRPDARFGPAHVREASRMMRSYHPGVKAYPFDVKHERITLLSRLPQEPSRATDQPF